MTTASIPYSDEYLRNLYQTFDYNRIFFDSPILKASCAIPFFGFIPSYILQSQINHEFQSYGQFLHDPNLNASVNPRIVELIEIKNHYKIAAVLGQLLTIALLVAGIALGTIPEISLAFGVIMLNAISIGLNLYHIFYNHHVAREISAHGHHGYIIVR